MIETNPDFMKLGCHSFWDHRLEAQASHAPPVGLEHFDLDSAVLDFFSWKGDSSKEFNDGAGNCSAIGLGNQRNSQFFFECAKLEAAGHDKHTTARSEERRVGKEGESRGR